MPDDNFDYQKSANERQKKELKDALSELQKVIKPKPSVTDRTAHALAVVLSITLIALAIEALWWAILWLAGNMP